MRFKRIINHLIILIFIFYWLVGYLNSVALAAFPKRVGYVNDFASIIPLGVCRAWVLSI